MRKKYTSKSYMRGVTDFDFVLTKREEENFYLTLKRVNKIDQPFVIEGFGKDSIVFIDNGYYIIEFTPLNQFYNARVFLDRDANVIGYYFDISRGNGEENNIPYYDDLYLDIVFFPGKKDLIEVLDEDELLEALGEGKITEQEYNLAKNTNAKLIEEIQKNHNLFINMDKKAIIEKYFH